MNINFSNRKSIKLVAELCSVWNFIIYQGAFLNLVEALKKENFDVTYTCNKINIRGALEVYVTAKGKEKV